jgi:Cdc6-like AAA superfamily ATPase
MTGNSSVTDIESERREIPHRKANIETVENRLAGAFRLGLVADECLIRPPPTPPPSRLATVIA